MTGSSPGNMSMRCDMAREVPEWIGKDDNDRVPNRVRARVFYRFEGTCMCGCARKIWPGELWECDHRIALINGGENRENNLWPLLKDHHKEKSADDVDEKSKVYRLRQRHLGLRKSKWRW